MAVLLIFLRRRRRRKTNLRTTWSKSWILKRQGRGVYANLLQELKGEDPESFRQYHRLDINSFNFILNMVRPLIQKKETWMRATISPHERLAVTLRYLATGEFWHEVNKYVN